MVAVEVDVFTAKLCFIASCLDGLEDVHVFGPADLSSAFDVTTYAEAGLDRVIFAINDDFDNGFFVDLSLFVNGLNLAL